MNLEKMVNALKGDIIAFLILLVTTCVVSLIALKFGDIAQTTSAAICVILIFLIAKFVSSNISFSVSLAIIFGAIVALVSNISNSLDLIIMAVGIILILCFIAFDRKTESKLTIVINEIIVFIVSFDIIYYLPKII